MLTADEGRQDGILKVYRFGSSMVARAVFPFVGRYTFSIPLEVGDGSEGSIPLQGILGRRSVGRRISLSDGMLKAYRFGGRTFRKSAFEVASFQDARQYPERILVDFSAGR